MNRSDYTSNPDAPEIDHEVHPVWRGIGCILLFVIPIMSFAAAATIIEQNSVKGWFVIPADLTRIPIPAFFTSTFPGWIADDFYAKVLVAIVFAVLFFGLFTVFYSMLYRMGGGYRPSPLDAPPPKPAQKPRR
jgi:hypothetical protein